MYLFDLRKFSSFQPADLCQLTENDAVWRLDASRRRQALLESNDQTSPQARLRYAHFLYDTGSFEEVLTYTSSILQTEQTPVDSHTLVRASALRCQSEFSLGKGRGAKIHLDEFEQRFGESSDPYVEATHHFVQGTYLLRGATGEPDALSRAADHFRKAAALYQPCGEVDLAILSRIEIAVALSSLGKYLRAIKKIELAMDVASEHSSFFYTGRMLATGAAAAADQGYRKGVESTLLRAVEWCEFVGDFWGRVQGLYALARLYAYEMPSGSPVAAALPERYFQEAIAQAESKGAVGLSAHITASLAWMYEKSGEAERRQHLLDQEDGRPGGRREHFEGMFANRGDVVKKVSARIPARLHDGIENHPDAFFIFDARRDADHRRIDFINEYRNNAGAKVLGLEPGTVFMYSEAQESPYLVGLAEAFVEAVERRESFQDHYRFDAGEESHWFARRIVPSGDGAILIVRDVTAEHRIELALRTAAESAERSDRSKSEFLANMSHEIRTPINGVLGLARLLSDTQLNPVQRQYVQDIIGSGDILISVIGNILDLSKMESLSMPLDLRPSVVEEIVMGTVRIFHGQAKEKGVTLTTTIAPSTPRAILADGARIRQIVANLVGNALKFTQQGTVSIEVHRMGGLLCIEVADSGIGIPEDRLEAIFDRFQQASSDSRVFGGTGLGLTISKGLVELMGGTLTVQSVLGKGSRFTVRLPVVESIDADPLARGGTVQSLEGIRVLLVDDNRVNNMVSKYALEKLGCVVAVANDGAEALEKWETTPLDLVLMDIRMPVLNGLDATRELRRREASRSRRTPVIALTAGALVEERNDCFEAGMDDYISKPFTDDLLREVIARWLPADRKATTTTG